MRVALACPYAWDAPGGVQLQVRGLAARLRDRGHETLVLAPSGRDWPEPGVTIVGRTIRVPFNGSRAPICPDPRSRLRIAAALHEFGPEVVHVHEPFAPSTARYATLAAEVPVVGTFHAYMERSILTTLFAPSLQRTWRRLSGRIAVSRAAAEFVGRHFHGGMRVVPNGVDVDRFGAAEPADLPPGRRLLFVNRLEPRKGFRVAVQAFQLVLARIPDALLVVAGDGPERRALATVPEAVRDRIVMLGTMSNTELPPYHAACEAFLAPATGRESFGIVLVEALAAGLPVAGSDIAGYREVVRDGIEGLLSRPGDPRAMAASVTTLLTDRRLHERLERNARKRAERFRWERVVAEVEEVYREAVAVGRP